MQKADINAEALAVARAVVDKREEKKVDDESRLMQHRGWDTLFIVSEIIMMILYALCTKYHFGASAEKADPSLVDAHNAHATEEVAVSFAMWVDVHTMIFIGFGFLMVFLKCHSWSSVGFNYLIAAWTIQCGILLGSFFRKALVEGFSEKIELSMEALLEGDFCAAACLITMGALLGKTTFTQLFFLVTCESIWYSVNMVLILNVLQCHDVGGAMTIHMFGAYFGLAATYFFQRKRAIKDVRGLNSGGYSNQMIAMIGTCFLFIYWPSFNSILAGGVARHLAIINTVLSITSSALCAMFTSRVMIGTLDMEVLLNSVLAGGVVMGAGCDIIGTSSGLPMLFGGIAGVVSAFGFLKCQEWCKTYLQLHDTCGVQFLHGIPGILGGIVTCLALVDAEGRFPNEFQREAMFSFPSDRSFQQQAAINFVGIIVTGLVAVASGAFCGYIASMFPMPSLQFEDQPFWCHVAYGPTEVPREDEKEHVSNAN
jgi:ammonium transporter Rh